MSYYSDPTYYYEPVQDLRAPEEISGDVTILDNAFKNVLNPDNYNQLELLRLKPASNNKAEENAIAPNQRTHVDMRIST